MGERGPSFRELEAAKSLSKTAGAAEERAASVAWLRANFYDHAAAAIERGDHLSRRGEDNGS